MLPSHTNQATRACRVYHGDGEADDVAKQLRFIFYWPENKTPRQDQARLRVADNLFHAPRLIQSEARKLAECWPLIQQRHRKTAYCKFL